MYRKVIFGVVLFSISMLSIVFLQFWTLGQLRDETSALRQVANDRLGLAVRINAYQDDGFTRIMELASTANLSEREHLLSEIDDLSTRTAAAIKTYADNLHGKSKRERVDNLIAARQQYLKIRNQLIDLVKNDHQSAALTLAQTALRQSYATYSLAVDELLIADSQSVSNHAARVNKFCSIIVFLVPAIGLLGFFVGFIVPVLGAVLLGKTAYEPNLAKFGNPENAQHSSRIRWGWILMVVIVLLGLGIATRSFF